MTVSSSLDLRLYQAYAYQFREQIIMMGLLGGLYGVLTVLSITSIYALIIRRRRIQPATIMLSFTILTLFTSTTIYVVTSILQCQYLFLHYFLDGSRSIWLYSTSIPFIEISGGEVQPYVKALSLASSCASPVTLTINVVLGDAIVWWRTCVIWNNRVIRAICGLSMLATLGLGAISAIQSCRPLVIFGVDSQARPLSFLGTSFEGLPLGIAACILSLGSNVFTTLLVAYKAWQSRRRLRKYLVAKTGGTPVEKLLTLLIESGAIYSAIWAVVVAYQVGDLKRGYLYNSYLPEPTVALKFLDIFGVMMSGALVPVIAIYPAIIIVLVALNSSHMERGLTQNLESIPTPCIDYTVNMTTTSLHESRLNRRSDVLVIGEQPQESRCGDVDHESEAEDAGRRTNEEWKGKGAVHNFQSHSNAYGLRSVTGGTVNTGYTR